MVERSVGPFTTHVRLRRPDGVIVDWSSRTHRKRASLLSRARMHPGVWWAPRRASWWIGALFAVGSICFLVAGYIAYVEVCGRPACRPRPTLE